MRFIPFLDRKAALVGATSARYKAGILPNEHVTEDGPTVFANACRLGTEAIVLARDGLMPPV
jgi:hypothetical protein